MQCPNCKSDTLKPAKLKPTLSCSICSECDGTLLSLVSYRLWRENHPTEIDEVEASEDPQDTEDTTRALLCPKCAPSCSSSNFCQTWIIAWMCASTVKTYGWIAASGII